MEGQLHTAVDEMESKTGIVEGRFITYNFKCIHSSLQGVETPGNSAKLLDGDNILKISYSVRRAGFRVYKSLSLTQGSVAR